MFDKLKFWKKNDDPLDTLEPMGNDPLGADPLGGISDPLGGKHEASPSFSQPGGLGEPGGLGMGQPTQHYPEPQPQSQGGKDIEVISAKLDAIRAQMDVINQRLIKIEKIAEGEYEMMQKNKYQW